MQQARFEERDREKRRAAIERTYSEDVEVATSHYRKANRL
jgi:hypothetical protein